MEVFNFNTYIKESNALFEKVSAAKKRVMIAQDTILRINKNNISPQQGSLLNLDYDFVDNFSLSDSFQEILNADEDGVTCEICAKGGLFCSYIGRVNKVKISEVEFICGTDTVDKESIVNKKLKELFSFTQLDLIEIAYEGKSYLNCNKNSVAVKAAESFYNNYKTPKERLIAICENIIANKGTFNPIVNEKVL